MSLVLLAAILTDLVLSARWNRTYFERGIIAFSKTASTANGQKTTEEFQVHFDSVLRIQKLAFYEIEPGVVAFRERWSGSFYHYLPLMHGVVEQSTDGDSVIVKGFLNCFVIIIALGYIITLPLAAIGFLPLGQPLHWSAWIAIGIAPLLFAFGYWIQVRRYKMIVQYACQ